MMPQSSSEQAKGTDSLDDPFPIGVFKFLKIIFFAFQIMKGQSQIVILRLLDFLWYFNRLIQLRKLEGIQNLLSYFVFQKYIKGVTGLSRIT